MSILVVEIVCPSTSRSYDFKIPSDMKAENIKSHLIEDIRLFEGSPELFRDKEAEICLFSVKGQLSGNETLESAGVKTGDRLTLV